MRPARCGSHEELESFRTTVFRSPLAACGFRQVRKGRLWPEQIATRQVCAIGDRVTFHYAVFELIAFLLESNNRHFEPPFLATSKGLTARSGSTLSCAIVRGGPGRRWAPHFCPPNASASGGGSSSQRIVARHRSRCRHAGDWVGFRARHRWPQTRTAREPCGRRAKLEPMVFMSDRCAEQREDAFDAGPR